jgi:hypothetical protein
MTNPKNGTVEGGERPPRRRPPTIDLEATEIASEPLADQAAQPGADVAEQSPGGGSDSPGTGPPGETTVPRGTVAGRTPSRRWRFVWFVGAFAAGASTAALLGAGALWSLGAVPFRYDTEREQLLAATVAALDHRIQELATQSTASPPSREADLEARLAALEAARSSPPPVPDATLARLSALEQRLNEAPRAAAANPSADNAQAASDHRDIEALTARIAALEQQPGDARQTAVSDRAVRLGLAAMELRMAVERGAPFSAELEAVSRLVDDPSDLAPLKVMADTGLPAPAALAQSLSKLTPAMLEVAIPTGHEGGVLDRLEAGAARLVRIRRIDDAPGDDPAAMITQADVKATRGDIAGAIAEIDKLPDKVRAPASGWISTARARLAALEAVRQISTHALQALGPLAP